MNSIKTILAVPVLTAVLAVSSAQAGDPRLMTAGDYALMVVPKTCRIQVEGNSLEFSSECLKPSDPDAVSFKVSFDSDGNPVSFVYRMKEGESADYLTGLLLREPATAGMTVSTPYEHTAYYYRGGTFESLGIRTTGSVREFSWQRDALFAER